MFAMCSMCSMCSMCLLYQDDAIFSCDGVRIVDDLIGQTIFNRRSVSLVNNDQEQRLIRFRLDPIQKLIRFSSIRCGFGHVLNDSLFDITVFELTRFQVLEKFLPQMFLFPNNKCDLKLNIFQPSFITYLLYFSLKLN